MGVLTYIARRVETVDVAPTISAYLGVKYPSIGQAFL